MKGNYRRFATFLLVLLATASLALIIGNLPSNVVAQQPLKPLAIDFRLNKGSVTVEIQDDGELDCENKQKGIIVFDSTGTTKGCKKFDVPGGYLVQGKVTLDASNELKFSAGSFFNNVITLTNFKVINPKEEEDSLLIRFSKEFDQPQRNVIGVNGAIILNGEFALVDPKGPVKLLNKQDKVVFEGFVNNSNQGGNKQLLKIEKTIRGNGFNPNTFNTPKAITSGFFLPQGAPPPWTLRGELTVTLKAKEDLVRLPNSAAVAISDGEIEAVTDYPSPYPSPYPPPTQTPTPIPTSIPTIPVTPTPVPTTNETPIPIPTATLIPGSSRTLEPIEASK